VAIGTAPAAQPAVVKPALPPGLTVGKGPNLVRNGNFEKLDAAGVLPEGWTTKHPKNVKTVDLHDGYGNVVEMTGDGGLMGTYGVDLVSDKIPFKANTRYAVTGYTKSKGPNFILFAKGYQWITHSENGKQVTTEEQVYQMRKEIPASKDWRPFHLDLYLRPTKEYSDFQHKIEYFRLTAWAYWPAGTGWFSDIQMREVGPLPKEMQIHAEAVTHLGVKPNLSEEANEPKGPVDEEQLSNDAINAFRGEEYDKAFALAQQLIQRSPTKGAHRLLAARAAVRLKKWDEAAQQAQWLLDAQPGAAEVQPWQLDWARLVRAEVLLATDHAGEAKALLHTVLESASSPHAKAEARRLLDPKRQKER
jgi:hypothetical protein